MWERKDDDDDDEDDKSDDHYIVHHSTSSIRSSQPFSNLICCDLCHVISHPVPIHPSITSKTILLWPLSSFSIQLTIYIHNSTTQTSQYSFLITLHDFATFLFLFFTLIYSQLFEKNLAAVSCIFWRYWKILRPWLDLLSYTRVIMIFMPTTFVDGLIHSNSK